MSIKQKFRKNKSMREKKGKGAKVHPRKKKAGGQNFEVRNFCSVNV